MMWTNPSTILKASILNSVVMAMASPRKLPTAAGSIGQQCPAKNKIGPAVARLC
jgi:hypothetical protein